MAPVVAPGLLKSPVVDPGRVVCPGVAPERVEGLINAGFSYLNSINADPYTSTQT